MADRAAFVAALEAEQAAFDAFVGILETESSALEGSDVEALIALAQQKSEKVAVLSRLSEERRAFLRSAGFPADRVGMAQWLVAQGNEGAPISPLWSRLLDSAARAQRLNDSNGALIESRLRFNQSALAALQSAARQTTSYGPDGTTRLSIGMGRDLGSA
ncbi:MAG: flagellar protein FlgN [Betaproteobacteria bacterium]